MAAGIFEEKRRKFEEKKKGGFFGAHPQRKNDREDMLAAPAMTDDRDTGRQRQGWR